MSEQMRGEFEAWYESAYGISLEREFRSNHFIGYVNDKANHRWAAWQASRAALCVELPKRVAYEQLDSAGVFVCLSYELNADSAGDTVELLRAADVAGAIHAAGVKTK